MTKYAYVNKDQNVQDETTIYWFVANNEKLEEFDGETFGVAHCGSEVSIVDVDGCPIDGAWFVHLIDGIESNVTDEMINDF
jgi:hypothetical protein